MLEKSIQQINGFFILILKKSNNYLYQSVIKFANISIITPTNEILTPNKK